MAQNARFPNVHLPFYWQGPKISHEMKDLKSWVSVLTKSLFCVPLQERWAGLDLTERTKSDAFN